ncbi:MAG TPA: SDR family oxidoreductase [Candidatus Binataceae bacterium]|jgi:NAD(P)-dependent dehydrogenase (short-subunit alcohol dehydrogenase family)|nr:SDR family oxidoreductase [Candidatus Binataceae bacterium]
MPDSKSLPEGLKDFALNGKVALVLGAEHALGRVAAITLAEAGAKVLIASQNAGTENALKDVAKAIEASGSQVLIQVQRAALRADLSAAMDLAVTKLGGLDILVTALDEPFFGPAEAADDSDFERVLENNFKTAWMAFQEAGRVMLKRGGGVIVNINSVLAERGVPNATLYCAAKGAVRNLVRALSLEWARRGIRLNMIECGWTGEEGSVALEPGDFNDKLIKYLPYRRLLQPEEIAGALLYLVSPAAGFVTGESIAVDGGLLCRV